jgi:predicted phosphohydrolase
MSRIFAIGDLHLSHAVDKPMDKFGEHWRNHPQKIAAHWDALVGAEDLVLVCGDSSWAMRWHEFEPDLAWLAARTGKKLLVRGNHDYWWPSIQKLRQLLPPGMMALQNDHQPWGAVTIVGSRGWVCPGSRHFKPEEDQKIYEREVLRLGLSLDSAPQGRPLVCMMHYPPTNERLEPSGFTELLQRHEVKVCVFGHLHGERAVRSSLNGDFAGTRYRLVSSDVAQFAPICIWADEAPV